MHGLTLKVSTSFNVSCFTNADWASCPDDRKSTSAYCTFVGSNLISWSSQKQRVVSRSSTEAEYRALANGAADVLWVHKLLAELRISFQQPSALYCDNVSAIQLAANPILHTRTKHVEIDYHFVREKVLDGTLVIHHVSSRDQLADPLTKLIPSHRFVTLRGMLTVGRRPSVLSSSQQETEDGEDCSAEWEDEEIGSGDTSDGDRVQLCRKKGDVENCFAKGVKQSEEGGKFDGERWTMKGQDVMGC
ncbi:hypothetical protein MLD38_039840 [Melastoma candidum]|uniref:Uncharacterized protein n=1 Tax=Melastoma candidum TaxID=119954 RepID=A0ACB9L3E1_9MYRT|nr:hypothetical protein MLD38_039840 [Melastoma candidum]